MPRARLPRATDDGPRLHSSMAIHYVDKQLRYFLTTNYKVRFSTLEQQPGLQSTSAEAVVRNALGGLER